MPLAPKMEKQHSAAILAGGEKSCAANEKIDHWLQILPRKLNRKAKT